MYKLQRYRIDSLVYVDKNDGGGWVKWDDVEPLLKAYLALLDDRKDKYKEQLRIP